MLRSSFSGEDPSDVDAGSEAATQTDRFGFILANGSSAGMGPSPELVRQREAKWISIINQWDHVLEKKNSKVKEQCQKGIPASLKAKCWPLLCGAADRMKQNKDVYQSLDSQPALQIWLDVIKRDLDRQFPFHEMFLSRDGHGQRELLRVLKAYTQYQPDEGYCQAQGPVAAVLLINMPAEEAFWCLVQISEQYLPGYYSQLLEGVLFDAPILTWVLKRACPAAHRHLQRHDVEPLMFATDWLMCLFTRHLPFNTLLRVWDLFFGYGVRVLFQVAAVLVRRVLGRAEQRRECQGQMETLERLRGIREQMKQENEDNFIAEVCSVSLSERDLNKRTEKELEKWRKERPSSTFDPRVRCHGYGAACVGVREREKERGEKEREMGNLSVPLTRSASTVSLSPSLLRKRWRKGGKAEASDWQGGGEVVRNLSMGVRGLGRETWTARRPLRVQSIQEEQHKAPKGRQNDTDANLIRPSEAEPKGDPSLPTSAPKESRALSSQEETVQVKPGKPEKFSVDVAQQETGRCDEEDRTTEKTSVEGPVKDSRPEHIIHRVEPTSELQPCANAEDTEPRCNSQLRQLEDPSAERNQEEEVENRDTLETRGKVEKQAGGEENAVSAEEKPSQINTDTESGTHTDTATQAVAGISDGQTDREPEPEAITENAQQTETHAHTVVTMQCESAAQNAVEFNRPSDAQTEGDTQEANTQDGLTPTELKEESPTPTENNRETETRESREENTETQEQTQAATPTEEECNDLHTNNTSLEETAPEEDARGQTAAAAEKDESDFEIPAAETAMCTETDTPASTEQAAEVFFVFSENESEFPLREPAQAHEETVSDADAEAEEDRATSAPSAGAAPTETEPPSRAAGSMTPSKRALLNSTAEPGDETSKEPLTVEQVSTGNVEERTGSARENVEKTEAVLQAYLPEPPRTQESHAVDSGSCAGELQEPPPFGEHDVLPSDPELMLVAGRRAHTCSGEFRVIKASSSQRSRLLRKLSEDLFSSSQLDGRPVADQPVADQRAEEPERASQSSPAPIRRDPKQPDTVSAGASPAPVPSGPKEQTGRSEGREGVRREEKPANTPKGLGLFRRLRGGQRGPKIQIPKILIQDFSDGVRVECAVQGEEEERLSSKERRRRRRARERREKEEEKTRKKREKGLEGERRNPQTRGKSFATQSDEPASRRSSAPHTDSYF